MMYQRVLAHGAMLLFSLFVSGAFVFGGMLSVSLDTTLLTFLRFLIAAILMAVVCTYQHYKFVHIFRNFWQWCIIGGLSVIYFICMFEALKLTTALSISAIFSLIPLFSAFLSFIFMKEQQNWFVITCILCGCCGVVLVVFDGDFLAMAQLRIGFGEFVFLIGAIGYSAVPVATKKLCGKSAPIEAAIGSIFGACFVLLFITLIKSISVPIVFKPNPAEWIFIIYIGIFTTAVTFFLLQYSIKFISGARTLSFTYLVPVWVFGWSLFAEREAPPLVWLGVCIISCAMLAMFFYRGDIVLEK